MALLNIFVTPAAAGLASVVSGFEGYILNMGRGARKPVFGVSDLIRLNPGNSAIETSWNNEKFCMKQDQKINFAASEKRC